MFTFLYSSPWSSSLSSSGNAVRQKIILPWWVDPLSIRFLFLSSRNFPPSIIRPHLVPVPLGHVWWIIHLVPPVTGPICTLPKNHRNPTSSIPQQNGTHSRLYPVSAQQKLFRSPASMLVTPLPLCRNPSRRSPLIFSHHLFYAIQHHSTSHLQSYRQIPQAWKFSSLTLFPYYYLSYPMLYCARLCCSLLFWICMYCWRTSQNS